MLARDILQCKEGYEKMFIPSTTALKEAVSKRQSRFNLYTESVPEYVHWHGALVVALHSGSGIRAYNI